MLDIVVMKNPLGEWNPKAGDRQTNLAIDYNEFEAIQNFINVSLTLPERAEYEKWIDHHEKLKKEYLNAASEKGYEMLGRIWYWYDDAIYFSSDINQLKKECLKAKSESQSSDLIVALDKILEVCDDALTTESGLNFGCD